MENAADSPVSTTTMSDDTTDDTAPIRVLHVDDEADFADLTGTFLERESDRLEVDAVTSPDEAETRLDDVDCVVSDHDMPGRDGIEFLRSVRESHPDLPFILFTGKGSEEVASRAISEGVTDYLRKGPDPGRYAVLANRIENAVEAVRSKHAAAERQRRFETLIDNLPGIVYQCRNEPGWPIESIEGECEAITGYPKAALERNEVTFGDDIVHPDDREAVWESAQAALDDREPFEHTFRIRTVDGETKWIWERGRGVYDEHGELERLEGFHTDISARKRRQRELERQNDHFDELASAISHDLRTPIATVRGRLQLALETGDQEHVETALNALDRVDELREDVVDVLRSREIVGEIEPVAITLVVEEIWESVECSPEASLAVGDLGRIEADIDALRRLLQNVLANAVEHGPDDVSIRVGPLENGFFVADDGPGIPPARREQVFDDGFTTKDDGIGMGMASVEQIVEEHGWDVAVTDAETLGGARIEIRER